MLASDMTAQHAQTVTDGLRKGEYKILFVSPERFVTSSFVSLLQSVPQVAAIYMLLSLFVHVFVAIGIARRRR